MKPSDSSNTGESKMSEKLLDRVIALARDLREDNPGMDFDASCEIAEEIIRYDETLR